MKRLFPAALLPAILTALPMQLPAADSIRNEIGMIFIRLPASEFIMGSQKSHPQGRAMTHRSSGGLSLIQPIERR
ncbi:MAG: hypothetical protein WBO34_15190 [Gammaproteobacteria bacterium]